MDPRIVLRITPSGQAPVVRKACREPTGPPLICLGDVLGIASLAAVEQPLDEASRVRLILIAAEEGGEAAEEAIEFGSQGQELLLVHGRSPRDG
jgi:hypothetical protein